MADSPSSGVGGVQKWTLSSGTWTQASTFAATLTKGVVGLTGVAIGGTVTLVATTTESPSRLVAFIDDGNAPSPTPLLVASAAANTFFRGVAFSPAP